MKENVSVKKLIETVDDMAKRGSLLARGDVSQEDLAMQIKGMIVHVAMSDDEDDPSKTNKDHNVGDSVILKYNHGDIGGIIRKGETVTIVGKSVLGFDIQNARGTIIVGCGWDL